MFFGHRLSFLQQCVGDVISIKLWSRKQLLDKVRASITIHGKFKHLPPINHLHMVVLIKMMYWLL